MTPTLIVVVARGAAVAAPLQQAIAATSSPAGIFIAQP
jgi:hypothetical protein